MKKLLLVVLVFFVGAETLMLASCEWILGFGRLKSITLSEGNFSVVAGNQFSIAVNFNPREPEEYSLELSTNLAGFISSDTLNAGYFGDGQSSTIVNTLKPGNLTITVQESASGSVATALVSIIATDLPVGEDTAKTGRHGDSWFSFTGVAGQRYFITLLDDSDNALLTATEALMSAYNGNLETSYYSGVASSSSTHQVITPSFDGTVYIRVEAQEGKTYTLSRVIPVEVASVEVSPASLSIEIGTSSVLTATVMPAEAEQGLSWSSSNAAVASVDALTGSVTARMAGTATITATSTDNASRTDSCVITVIDSREWASWTVMYYGDADNNLELYLLDDIAEMKSGLRADADTKVIVLFDRIDGETSDAVILEEDFQDTRLYRILPGDVQRIGGSIQMPQITTTSNFEANMGDVATLAAFINFCKANYPAEHYALFFSNHGGGARSPEGSSTDPRVSKAVCWDDTNGEDALYTAELTDGLSSAHSVDLLVYDACFMGTIEVAYQYRPGTSGFSADYLAASAPTLWGYGLPYDTILERIRMDTGNNGTPDATTGGLEAYLAAATMTPTQFGALIVEEMSDSAVSSTSQSFSLYDLSSVATLKSAVDALAVALASGTEKADTEGVRGSLATPGTLHYFDAADENEWISYPYFDVYSLASGISASSSFSTDIKNLAANLAAQTDAIVLHSFGGSDFTGFVSGKSGLSIFFPDGDRLYQYDQSTSYRHWAYDWWYSPIDTNEWWPGGHYYGKLAWCADGRTTNGQVQNWFEMLDFWFDASTYPNLGYNGVAP